jgi:hypothetical protein
MTEYNLKITKKQAEVISAACDVYSRLMMGQINEAFDILPLKKNVSYGRLWEIKETVRDMLPDVLVHGIDGNNSSLGVGSPDLNSNANIAVDIHQVIRHKISWENAVEEGLVESENSPRKWVDGMIGVNYDTPFHWGTEPLVEFGRIEK